MRTRSFVAVCLLLAVALAAACRGGDDDRTVDDVPERTGHAIADLIAAAPSGGTVFIPEGHYHEQIDISKPLTIRPEASARVIIDGDCERESGIRIPTGSGIDISGLEIRNTIGAGVFIGFGEHNEAPAEEITIDSMVISDFDCQSGEDQFRAGIAVWNAACCMRLTNNTITYRTVGDPHGQGNGIWFKSTTEMPSGGGHHISGNTITGGWDGIGGETESDPHGTFDGNTIVERNHVIGCWDDGIQVEGGATDVRVIGNEIEGCGTGIAFAPAVTGPLYVEQNYIHDLEMGLYENLFCYKIGNEGAGVVHLTSNICRTHGDGMLQTNEGISPIISRGNCFDVSRYVMETDGNLPEGSSFDGDFFWTTDPDRFIKWGSARFDDLESFRAATGFEENGVHSKECPLQSLS